jgi:hypothetical protein
MIHTTFRQGPGSSPVPVYCHLVASRAIEIFGRTITGLLPKLLVREEQKQYWTVQKWHFHATTSHQAQFEFEKSTSFAGAPDQPKVEMQ